MREIQEITLGDQHKLSGLGIDSKGQTFYKFGRSLNAKYFATLLVFSRIDDFADDSLDWSWFGSAGTRAMERRSTVA